MPSLTPRQHRAMWASAKGKSNIGIPQDVGKEFVAADKEVGVTGNNKRSNRSKMSTTFGGKLK